MHLSKMKLAGFKSFVDPTTIIFPSYLVSVVGPNGCGKSNVIDAVSWVLGESSPKYLRGESSTDVIFNGSTARKPVGQASVELIFDNQDGTLSGEYASYNEVSIKRVINRVDGEDNHSDSSYFLNGARCRKRDITDLFLGTGLGPRSYSIIGQNMIAKITEAKPDELRSYLEEAAGISKYKERRHETSLRMQHTTDNLARVNDVRAELEKQLAHLEQQAKTAERYKQFKQDERRLKAETWALEWRDWDAQMVNLTLEIQREETMLESQQASLVKLETSMDASKHEQRAAQDVYQVIQKRYYGIANDVTRVEQEILFHQEKQDQFQNELDTISSDMVMQKELLQETERETEQLSSWMESHQPEREALNEHHETLQSELAQLESEHESHQSAWDEFVQESAKTMKTAEVEKTNCEHFEKDIQSYVQRKEKIALQQNMMGANDPESVDHLKAKLEQLDEWIKEHTASVDETQQKSRKIEETIRAVRREREQLLLRIQQLKGRETSLEALQEAALNPSKKETLNAFLKAERLQSSKRLVNHIKADSTWSSMVERVLGLCLQAVCVDDFTFSETALSALKNENVCLLKSSGNVRATRNEHINAPFLIEKINSSFSIEGVLHGIYAVDSLSEALLVQTHLKPHESIVSQDGFWLGATWIKALHQNDPTSGVLERAEELTVLRAQLEECEQAVQALDNQLDAHQQSLRDAQESVENNRKKLMDAKQSRAGVEAELRAKTEKQKMLSDQYQLLKKEEDDLTVRIRETEERLQESKQRWQESMRLLEEEADVRITLQHKKDQHQERIRSLRNQLNSAKDKLHQLTLNIETKQSSLKNAKQNAHRIAEHLKRLKEREEHARSELQSLPAIEDVQERLSKLLDSHVSVETEMNTAKTVLEALEQDHEQLEQNKHQVEQSIERYRTNLESFRVAWQGVKVNIDHVLQQFTEHSQSLEETLKTLPETAQLEHSRRELEQITNRINRLGAINLVAIEEYQNCLERKSYLDQQVADLEAGLRMLADAIEKIDAETKQRFKETFDQVNHEFSTLFPTVFGGGKAYLELTSDDLLEAGVTMMACPPGKRNSTIYLLSGGEKSLTALAFIFSIFHLNPAPFCMLDEVDAALDDTNVMRFCRLLNAMSTRTQFIYISHNKIAIEAAHHLMGVTMHEPGVSRIVSVDVEKAIELSES